MSSDYPVESRSNDTVRLIAKKCRASFAVIREGRVDLIASLQQQALWTVFGVKRLHFSAYDDSELPDSEGITIYGPGAVTIKLKRSVHQHLKLGEGRAANTAAHELGHAVMHEGPPLHRSIEDFRKVAWIPSYRSAEHQAKVFAPAFLIDDEIAEALSSPEEISITFGTSYESAKIWARERREAREKPKVVEKLRRFASELGPTADQPTISYLNVRCPNCSGRTLFPVGVKYMCQTCDRVFDGFQDGDALDD